MYSRRRKRSQMEIMGLAIIMILVMLGVLFAIRFVLKKPDTDIRKSYLESQQASNMINAMLGTTTDCHDTTIKELLQDCAVTASIDCDGASSCDYVDNAFATIFAETFISWKREFRFYIDGPSSLQALEYGEMLDVPFVYCSNGDAFIEHDFTKTEGDLESEIPLNNFPTPTELWRRYCIWKNISQENEHIITQDYIDCMIII